MTRWLWPIFVGLVIFALLVAWIGIAPGALGGRALYVTTAGVSMEPGISQGDLVVLREDQNYDVGDIVGYDSGGSLVLHRIIGDEGGRFIVKGDSNPTPDAVRPTVDEIRGRLWLQLTPPWEWSSEEAGLAVLVVIGLVTLVLVAYIARERLARVSVRSPLARLNDARSSERFARMLGPLGQILIAAITILALGALLLAVVGFSRPLERQALEQTPYEHRISFGYSAPSESAIYDNGIATTGNPLYRGLVETITVDIDYRLNSELPANVGGTFRVDMAVSSRDGWRTTRVLVADQTFSGGQFNAEALLELEGIELLIASFELGTSPNPTTEPFEYEVSIISTVQIDGSIGSQQVRDTFAPSLDFQMDERMLYLRDPGNGDIVGAGAIQSDATRFVTENRAVPNTVAFLVGDLDVSTARQLAIAGLALAIILGTATLLLIRSGMQAPEAAQIDARYSSRILELRAANLKTTGRLVEVASFEDLLKVAEQARSHVLHYIRDGQHVYFVPTREVVYGYRPRARRTSEGTEKAVKPSEERELRE